MKALVYQKYGSPKNTAVIDVPEPSLKSGEVLIKVLHAGVNPVDWKIGEGRMQKHYSVSFPLITGRDFCGIVEKVGLGLTKFSTGDVVYGCLPGPGGAFAEFVAADERLIAHAPTSYSSAEIASLPLASLTCWQALVEHAKISKGDVLFVLSGGGGTGSIAIQLAIANGATVITTCSTANREYVISLGASKVYDYSNPKVVDEIHKDHPSGVDVVFSNALGTLHYDSYHILRSGGTMVTIGEAPVAGMADQKGIFEVEMVVRPNGYQLSSITQLVNNELLTPPAVTLYDLAAGALALEKSVSGHTRGKIVLSIG